MAFGKGTRDGILTAGQGREGDVRPVMGWRKTLSTAGIATGERERCAEDVGAKGTLEEADEEAGVFVAI